MKKYLPIFKGILFYALLTGATVLMSFPLFWLISSSLKTLQEPNSPGIVWVPQNPTLDAYTAIFQNQDFLRAYFNSVFYVTLALTKVINDTFGHAAGDALLAELGRILRMNLRVSDIPCRYGGDEFVLILPDSSLDDTRHRVQQILELVKELRIWHGDVLLESLAVSAGVVVAHENNYDESEILRSADEALYAAKQAGHDQIVTNLANGRLGFAGG